MTKKKIIILIIILFVIGQVIYLTRDYIWPTEEEEKKNIPIEQEEEIWDYDKYFEIGYNQEELDQLFDEIKELKSLIKTRENDYTDLAKLGNIYMMLKEYKKAERAFLQAIEINPNYGIACYNLGELYSSFLSDKIKAEEYYRKAIELSPWRSQYYRSLADLYWSDFPEKENEIEPLILSGAEKYPENPDFYTYLASYFRQKENIPKAIDYLKKALEIEPDKQNLKDELKELEGIYGQ